MKRASPWTEPRDLRRRFLSLWDIVQIVYALLFLILGLIILFRVFRLGGSPLGFGVGGGFVVVGIFRLRFVLRYLLLRRKEGRSDVGR
jgi:NhaP-type Na+/H+ or K+/H+ antiporter